MKSLNFRDNVLHPIAWKLGYDPDTNFQKNQAYAIATYINAWVRRAWDAIDWPEWTVIYRYAISDNHYLAWTAMPNDFVPIPRPPLPPAPAWKIGRPLKVYSVDPRTTWLPVDTPFRATELGIHCGFEHGSNVWLKFLPPAPQYSSREWDAVVTYHVDDLVYWPITGECYQSKINNNIGHAPDDIILGNQSPLGVEELQPYTPPTPGFPEVTEIDDAIQQLVGTVPPINGIWRVNQTAGAHPPPADPAPAGDTFVVTVYDASHTIIANVPVTGGGSLSSIWNQLASQLSAILTNFISIHVVTSGGSTYLHIEDDSDFTVTARWIIAGVFGSTALDVVQTQVYNPAPPIIFTDPPVAGTVLEIRVLDATNAVIGSATVTATGSQSLAAIWDSWRTQLLAVPALSGFTITIDSDGHLQVEHASVFSLRATRTIGSPRAPDTLPIVTVQQQAYQPAIPPTPVLPQILKLTITEQQVVPDALYQLSFRTGDNAEHDVFYVTGSIDNALTILTGFANAIIVAQATDPFFQAVSTSIDTVSPSETFTIDVIYGEIGLHAVLQPPGTIFWDVVHFPLALVDQVVRGAVADVRGEQGQTDKEGAEEQKVPMENQVRVGTQLGPEYLTLSDQQKPKSRYAVK